MFAGDHTALTLATDIPVYFAHAFPVRDGKANENTNGIVREYFRKGTEITGAFITFRPWPTI